eukprot:403349087
MIKYLNQDNNLQEDSSALFRIFDVSHCQYINDQEEYQVCSPRLFLRDFQETCPGLKISDTIVDQEVDFQTEDSALLTYCDGFSISTKNMLKNSDLIANKNFSFVADSFKSQAIHLKNCENELGNNYQNLYPANIEKMKSEKMELQQSPSCIEQQSCALNLILIQSPHDQPPEQQSDLNQNQTLQNFQSSQDLEIIKQQYRNVIDQYFKQESSKKQSQKNRIPKPMFGFTKFYKKQIELNKERLDVIVKVVLRKIRKYYLSQFKMTSGFFKRQENKEMYLHFLDIFIQDHLFKDKPQNQDESEDLSDSVKNEMQFVLGSLFYSRKMSDLDLPKFDNLQSKDIFDCLYFYSQNSLLRIIRLKAFIALYHHYSDKLYQGNDLILIKQLKDEGKRVIIGVEYLKGLLQLE